MTSADSMAWLPSDDTPLSEAAIAYASHGFLVLPVHSPKFDGDRVACSCGRIGCETQGKHPIERGWQKRATSEPDAALDARRAHPNANIGLAMGGARRLVAVDIDGEQGRRSWAELEAKVRPVPQTLTSRSGRADGGEHRLFTVPAHLDMKRLGNRSSAVKMGIDTRIDNGQIVVAPSVHKSGARYTWVHRVPVAEMPEWLFEALASPIDLGRPPPEPAPPTGPSAPELRDAYLAKALENAVVRIAGQTEGGRNALLLAKSCTLFEYCIGEAIPNTATWHALYDAGVACGLPAGEVQATLTKAWKRVEKSAGRKVPAPKNPAPNAPPTAQPPPADWDKPTNQPSSTTATQESDRAWESTLTRTGEGQAKNTFGNVCKILRHAPEFKGRLSFNQMRGVPCLDNRIIEDADFARIRELIEEHWYIAAARDSITQGVGLVASEKPFHPVQNYLNGLAWDGTARIAKIATEVLGCASADALTLRMLRCWFISAVARALRPGCKVDTVLVLVGEQRRKKSTFFRILGGEWFSDTYADIRTKDGLLQIHAAWLYEWAEIERVTTRNESGDVKSLLTSSVDDVRPPYGMGIVSKPRSSVIVGTTNKVFLDDETGSRRYHPVRVEQLVNGALLSEWRDQLWAEAVVAFKAGEEWWFSEEEERAREAASAEHTVENPLLEKVAYYLSREGRLTGGVTCADVMVGALGLDLGRTTHADTTRIGKTLQQLGWKPRQEVRGNARVRVYRPAAQPNSDGVQRVGTDSQVIPITSHPAHPTHLVSEHIQNENRLEAQGNVPPQTVEIGCAGCEGVQAPNAASPSIEPDQGSFASWIERESTTD